MTKMPIHLSEITLQQAVDFYNQYGRALDVRYRAIQQMEEGSQQRTDEYLLYDYESATQHYSFYTGTPLDEVLMLDAPEVVIEANTAMIHWSMEMPTQVEHGGYDWEDYTWQIAPILTKTKNLSHAEFEMVQDLALIFSDLQDGKIEALTHLCAAYLRKRIQPNPVVNNLDTIEPYHTGLTEAGSDRVKLMSRLPLSIALVVKLYIEQSINLYNARRS